MCKTNSFLEKVVSSSLQICRLELNNKKINLTGNESVSWVESAKTLSRNSRPNFVTDLIRLLEKGNLTLTLIMTVKAKPGCKSIQANTRHYLGKMIQSWERKKVISHRFLGAVMSFLTLWLTSSQCHMNNGTPVTKTTSPAQYVF